MPLTIQTKGKLIHSKPRSKKEEGRAIFSGYMAAIVLGATSARIKKTVVQIMGANAIPASPNISIARIVAKEAAAAITQHVHTSKLGFLLVGNTPHLRKNEPRSSYGGDDEKPGFRMRLNLQCARLWTNSKPRNYGKQLRFSPRIGPT